MDNQRMLTELKRAGVCIAPGMSDVELDRAESVFGFRFPAEIRDFLSCGVPEGARFFDYRDTSEENQERYRQFQESVENSFRFDLENNRDDLLEMLGKKIGYTQDHDAFDGAVIRYLKKSVKLIPFYGNRCFFDGMDDMPIVSFWQSVDRSFMAALLKITWK